MRYRKLGRTGFEVSEISLGTVEIGMAYGIAENGAASPPDEAAAGRLLHRALDLGINFIDTARAYGESEGIIGRALRGRRKEFYLASKVVAPPKDTATPAAVRDRVRESVQESLHQLQTDVIDMVMIHSAPLDVIQSGDVLEVLQDYKQKGVIRATGASVYGEEAALAAIATGACDCLQIAYSVLDRRPESQVVGAAAQADVGLVARSVLLKGALTDRCRHLPDALAGLKEAVGRMQALADRAGMSLPELAYRYVLSQDSPQTALVGTGSIPELEQAVGFASRGPLSSEQMSAIHAIAMPSADDLNPGTWPRC